MSSSRLFFRAGGVVGRRRRRAVAASTVTTAAASFGTLWYYFDAISDDERFHAARRVATASKHLVPVYFDYRRHVARVRRKKREREREEEDGGRALTPASVEELERESRQELWTDVAVRLRDLARENGGIYVKAGQHLCVQPVAPAPFREILRVLMDDASSRPFEEDEKTFSEEFNLSLIHI